MSVRNSLVLIFTNGLDSNFTLGKLNDGLNIATLSQDMQVFQSVDSPLTSTTQKMVVGQVPTLVDTLRSIPVVGVGANPNGCVAVTVVWTNYDVRIRFGLSASIMTTRLDGALNSISGAEMFGSITTPTIVWSYMIDSTPDQPGTWIQPSSLTAPVTSHYPGLPQYLLTITPFVGESSLQINCQITPGT